jgi:hypothetical protein
MSSYCRQEAELSHTFYFHVHGSAARLRDDEGVQLPSIRAAVREAVRARRELAKEEDAGRGWAFVIADESGRTLLRVPLGATSKRT